MSSIILQLVDKSVKHPYELVENMLIEVGELIFLADFIILNTKKVYQMPIILGRLFLSTSRALFDFDTNETVLRVKDK